MFIQGTEVWTKSGLVEIQEIKIGDLVLSKPEDGSGERDYRRVTQVHCRTNEPISVLKYWDQGGGGEIFASEDSPVWTKNFGWLPVWGIRDDDSLDLESAKYGPAWSHIRTIVHKSIRFPGIGWIAPRNKELSYVYPFGGWPTHPGSSDGPDTMDIYSKDHDKADPYLKAKTFSLDVEEFGTYYVDSTGIWARSRPISREELQQNTEWRKWLRY